MEQLLSTLFYQMVGDLLFATSCQSCNKSIDLWSNWDIVWVAQFFYYFLIYFLNICISQVWIYLSLFIINYIFCFIFFFIPFVLFYLYFLLLFFFKLVQRTATFRLSVIKLKHVYLMKTFILGRRFGILGRAVEARLTAIVFLMSRAIHLTLSLCIGGDEE